MKLVKSGLISLSALALPAVGTILPQLKSRTSCGKISNNALFRRLFSPTAVDHFYTWDGFEEIDYFLNRGYVLETELGGRYFPQREPGTVPFYRLFNNVTTTHLFTTSTILRDSLLAANPPYALEGSVNESGVGISGFVYLDGSCPKTVPLFWASSASLTDNFYTINVTEYNTFVANGYQANGIAAWIYNILPSDLHPTA